jgi:hypothetical protein
MLVAALLVTLAGCSWSSTPDGNGDGSGNDEQTYYPDGRTNYFGTHTFVFGGDDIDAHLDVARYLVGEGGYVKQMFGPVTTATTVAQPLWIDFIRGVYNRGMVPIIRLNMPYNADDGYYYKPETNDGSDPGGPEDYSDIASAIANLVDQLPRTAGQPLFIEIANETNLDYEWEQDANPVEYAWYLVAVYDAIQDLDDPRILVMNGGLSPQPDTTTLGYGHVEYIETMFDQVPLSIDAFDVWGTHAYPGWQPPEDNNHDGTIGTPHMSIDPYVLELDVLEDHGRGDVEIYITETAYSIGNVNAAEQADYTYRAFRDFWSQWPEVKAVTPFILWSEQTDTWSAFEWVSPDTGVNADGSPTDPYEHYTLVANLPKPPARQWPQFDGLPEINMETVSGSLAFEKPVEVSSSIEAYGWAKVQVNDGLTGGIGWTSEGNAGVDEWVVVDLEEIKTVSEVKLYPRGGDEEAGKFFPVTFEIQVSDDKANWETVYSHSYAPIPNEAIWRITEAYTATFAPENARYVRLLVTDKTNHGSGGYHVQLSELEVF